MNQHHLCLLLKYCLISLVYKVHQTLPGFFYICIHWGWGLGVNSKQMKVIQAKSPYELRDKSWNSCSRQAERQWGYRTSASGVEGPGKVPVRSFWFEHSEMFGHPVRQACQESNCRRIGTASKEKLSPSEEGRLSGLVHMRGKEHF